MIKYNCSNGERVSQATIDRRRAKSHLEFVDKPQICWACCRKMANDFDHTIAQARCKVIGKTELIWAVNNQVLSCRLCHSEWESFKSGEYKKHLNYETRIAYLKENDEEGWQKRVTDQEHSE